MTPAPSAGELVERVSRQVSSWPKERRKCHGFDLLVGDLNELLRRRRSHARTVLVAEAFLEHLGSAQRPVVLMKGLEVAQIYPAPVQRPFRDLDLLVPRPRELWDEYVGRGYRPNPNRRFDIDHHHLPALAAPSGPLGIEFHLRPNVPAWAHIPTDLLLETAERSRTGISGIYRPRDDLHALLMALHCWKGGFTRLRDLLDALLLACVSTVPVEETADELGLTGVWNWTLRFADAELFGRPSTLARIARLAVLSQSDGLAHRRRTRLLAPFLAANPRRVIRGHVVEYKLGRHARQPAIVEDGDRVNRCV